MHNILMHCCKALAGSVFCFILVACGDNAQFSDYELVQRAKVAWESGDFKTSGIELKNALQQNPGNAEARLLLGKIYLELFEGAAAQKELERALELGVPLNAIIADLNEASLLQRDFKGVLERLSEIDSENPVQEAQFAAFRGDAYLGQAKWPEAEEQYTRALGMDMNSIRGQIGLAKLSMVRGQWEKASSILEQITSKEPTSVVAWILLGNVASNQGNYQDAVEAYNQAIEQSFFSVTAHLQRAIAYIFLQDFESASKDLKAVKRTAERFPRVQYVQGMLQFHKKEFDLARSTFEKVLNKMPDNLAAKYYLGASNYSLGNYQQAKATLASLVAVQPNYIQGRILLGATYLKLGELASAERILVPTEKVIPKNHHVTKLLGELYFAKGEVEKSVEYLSRAQAANLEDDEVQLGLGVALLESGDVVAGLDVLEKLAEKGSEKGELALYLGMMKLGHYQQAAEVARRMIEAYPDQPIGKLLMARSLLKKGDSLGARSALEAILEQYPGHPGAALSLAEIAEAAGESDQAEKLYKQVLEHNPGQVTATMQLVQLYARAGDIQKAKTLLDSAIKHHPDDLTPRLFMANYYRNQGEATRAFEILEGGKGGWSGDPRYLQTRAEIELSLNQYASAERSTLKLLQVLPENVEGYYLLGRARLGMQQLGQAQAALEQAVKLQSNHIPANIVLARIYFLRGKQNDARSMLDALKNSHPNNPEVLGLEGWLAMRSGDSETAAKALAMAARQAASPRLVIDLARMLWESLRFEQAQATLDLWLEKHPDDVRIRFEKASYYLLENRPNDARTEFERVLQLAPTHVESLNNLASLYRKDDPVKALNYVKKAYELAPDSPVALDTYSMVLLETGDTDQALRMLERALEIVPDNPRMQYHKALILLKRDNVDKAKIALIELLRDSGNFIERNDAAALLEKLQ